MCMPRPKDKRNKLLSSPDPMISFIPLRDWSVGRGWEAKKRLKGLLGNTLVSSVSRGRGAGGRGDTTQHRHPIAVKKRWFHTQHVAVWPTGPLIMGKNLPLPFHGGRRKAQSWGWELSNCTAPYNTTYRTARYPTIPHTVLYGTLQSHILYCTT